MTVGELKKLIAPVDDSLRVMHNTGTERVPVDAAQIYREQELSRDEKSWVTVEMLDIS